MDYVLAKDITFTTTTIIFLVLYFFNFASGLYIISKGVAYIESFWYNILVFSTLTSLTALTALIASVDWFVFKQYMHLDFYVNSLWTFHHSYTSICFLQIHFYFLWKINNQKHDFWDKIKHSLDKVQKCS